MTHRTAKESAAKGSGACIGAMLLAGCAAPYEPPCEVVASRSDVAEGISGTIVPQAEQGPLVVQCIGARGPTERAEIAQLSLDGLLQERWSIPLPDETWARLGTADAGALTGSSPQCSWTGKGLAISALQSEPTTLADGTVIERSIIVYRHLGIDGALQFERPLGPTECDDCQLIWTSVPYADGVALLVTQRKAQEEGLGTQQTQSLLLLNKDGTTAYEDDLSWLATRATLQLSSRGHGLTLTAGSAAWLLSETLEISAGPIRLTSNSFLVSDWSLSDGLVTSAWVAYGDDLAQDNALFFRRANLDGSHATSPELLSKGVQPLAVHNEDGLLSVGFAGDGKLWLSIADENDNKLGGDISLTLPQSAAGSSFGPTQMLLRSAENGSAAFVGHAKKVDWLRVSCAP